MRPRWKLFAEGLGPIGRAEVDIHPLLLFVGENGAGKTALASLLWGLYAMQRELSLPSGPTLEACERWLARRATARADEPPYALDDEDARLFTQLFNEILEHDATHLVRRIFNDPIASVSSLRVQNAGFSVRPRLTFQPGPDAPASTPSDTLHISSGLLRQMGPAYQRHVLKRLAAHVAIGRSTLQDTTSSSLRRAGDPVFVPAGRTGFMLLHRSVVLQRMELRELGRTEPEDGPSRDLPSPVAQFLDMLDVGMGYERGPYDDEAALLEQCLDGTIELINRLGANDYHYHPTGRPSLPMSHAPSVVTELAPLILVLRHLASFPVLVIDEPTALLHPRLHRKLAQAIVRLIRKGLYVWITTTSESFCRQINHFLRIGARIDRARLLEELGHGEQDYLEIDDVAGYELTLEGGQTTVRSLPKFEGGLALSGFDEELSFAR